MEKNELTNLEKKFDILIKLIAYQIISGKNLTEGAPILKRIGLKNNEIADIYGTTINTVGVRLAESKKKSTTIKK